MVGRWWNTTKPKSSDTSSMIECIKVYGDGRLLIIFGGGYEVEEYLVKE